MRTLLTPLACAALCAALSATTAAQASVITFNDPAAIAIDPDGTATYSEAGFNISGQAASFLTLDDQLVGGLDSSAFSLQAAGGLRFGLQSLEVAFYDLGFGAAPGVLSIVGLLNGASVASMSFPLGASTTATFGATWANLTELRFAGSTGFALDNINVTAVPEPGTLLLTALALAALAWQMGGRGQRLALLAATQKGG